MCLSFRLPTLNSSKSALLSLAIVAASINLSIADHAHASDMVNSTVDSEFISTSDLLEKLIPISGDEGLVTERSIDLDIRFALGSAELDHASLAQIEALADALASTELSDASIKVYGHTDAIGSEESNQALSEARAASVVAAILSLVEFDTARIESAGFGESRLKDPDNPESGVNRRVEIVAVYQTVLIEHPDEQSLEHASSIEVIEVVPEEGMMIIE